MAGERADYEAQVRALRSVADEMLERGASPEFVARAMVARRNDLKTAFRSELPAVVLEAIEMRNLERYGHPVGPTAHQQLLRYGSWDAVIAAACRHVRLSSGS